MQQTETAPAPSLGAYLRSLRETKGSSLEDMARSTRVGIRHLEALEEERLADLPSPVFVRGFIRAYCGFLRESPESALGHYQGLLGERATTEAASVPPRPRATWANSSLLIGLGLLVILGAGLIALNMAVKRTGGTSVAATKMERPQPTVVPAPAAAPAPAPPAAPPAPQPTAAARPPAPPASVPAPAPVPEPTRAPSPPAAVAPAPPPPAAAATKAAPGGQRLVIKALEPTWVRVQTDEGRIFEDLLPAGSSREWTADRRFLLTIGNAGGVELTLNGKSLPPLGPKGTVIQRLELPAPPTTSGS
jgi:cytoskeleton protein RodZ